MSEPEASSSGTRGAFDLDRPVNPVDPAAVKVSPDAVRGPGRADEHPAAPAPTVRLRHNRIELALHLVREATGSGDAAARPLLLLHGLGERTLAVVPAAAADWPGPVWGLDFTGHGWSSVPRGGGYTVELLMADADAALAHLGRCTVFGRGLGAYVALLLAGARPTLVHGVVLTDGPGIVGGGIGPGAPRITVAPALGTTPDPFALAELTVDVRPPDYATTYLHQAVQLSELSEPISICGVVRPPWLDAVEGEPGVWTGPADEALARYATP